MTETIRHIRPGDHISRLYKTCEGVDESNILQFQPPLSIKALEILDDVEALLENPETRALAENILSEAIYDIAAKFPPST